MIRLAFAIVFGFAIGVAAADQWKEWKDVQQVEMQVLPQQEILYRTVLCPKGEWIAQRYDTWSKGKELPVEIKQRQWIRHCV